MLVTVSVYVPRLPLVLKFAPPVELVVAVCVTVVPPGLVQMTVTTAPDTAAPLPSLTTTFPVTPTFFPCSAADKLIAVLRIAVALAGFTMMVTEALALALLLSVTVSVAVKVPALV